jgi:hypothetical protein
MSTVEELTNLCGALKKEHFKNLAAPDILNKIIAVYEGYSIKSDSYFTDVKAKTYFNEEFTPEIIQSIVSIKKIEDNEVIL